MAARYFGSTLYFSYRTTKFSKTAMASRRRSSSRASILSYLSLYWELIREISTWILLTM